MECGAIDGKKPEGRECRMKGGKGQRAHGMYDLNQTFL